LEIALSRQAVEVALLWNKIRIDDIYRLSDNELSKPVSEALALSSWAGQCNIILLEDVGYLPINWGSGSP